MWRCWLEMNDEVGHSKYGALQLIIRTSSANGRVIVMEHHRPLALRTCLSNLSVHQHIKQTGRSATYPAMPLFSKSRLLSILDKHDHVSYQSVPGTLFRVLASQEERSVTTAEAKLPLMVYLVQHLAMEFSIYL